MLDLLFTEYAEYAGMVAFICYVLAHVISYLPVSLTTKIPDFVMVVLNTIAAKHGPKKTDMKGNSVETD